MIDKVLASKMEKNSVLSLEAYSALKFKWLAKISDNRHRISNLMHKILADETLNDSVLSTSEPDISTTIFERLQVQQKKLLHIISNLIFSRSISESNDKENNPSSEVVESDLISWLKEKEYISLAKKLELQNGYPWDEFKKIRSPIIIEQLVEIYLLCNYKKLDSQHTHMLINFALHFSRLVTSFNIKEKYIRSYELINDTKQMLGQFLYLINQDPQIAIEAIDVSHYQKALENIENTFSGKMQEICERLQNHYLAHYATQLQDPEVALYTKIPVEIAHALLTDIGTINVGIIDSLSDIFLSQEVFHINYESNLAHALNLLQYSPKFRDEFEKIHAPYLAKNPSNPVIKASLNLPPEHSVDRLDTQLTALIALLSHLRQGIDRSCFAVSLANEMLSAHLGLCFKDFRQLLEEGKLTRHIKGIFKDIPFVKKINDENLHKIIIFNAKGEFTNQNQNIHFLWEAPGLLAACQSIGIQNPKDALLNIIQQLRSPVERDLYKMKIKSIIRKLCEQKLSTCGTHSSLDYLYNQACFAFSSQTSQPLLKVWENAIANMAEAEEGSMIKTAILESTLDALQFKLGSLNIPPSLLLQRFFLSIQKSLYEKIQLRYDPTLVKFACNIEAKTLEGGFILYNQAQKIDNEKLFRLFVINVLLEVHDKMCQNANLRSIEIQQLNQTIEILTSYIDSQEFMNYLLIRYHPANRFVLSQCAQNYPSIYSQLQFAPWITRTGNDSKALLRIYLESEKPITAEKFVVSSAQDALKNIIEMCKNMPDDEKKLFFNNPNKLRPFCVVGKHRLPFMAGHPSLVSAWQQEYSTQQWIEHFVIEPGRKIAESIIDKETQKNLIQHLEEIFLKNMSQTKFETAINLIKRIPDGLTIKQYRNEVLKIYQCTSLLPLENLVNKFVCELDTALCQSLETNLKQVLEDSAVHFADTNWCDGSQDLHFCFAVNPGNGELELWEARANGSHLVALDQNYWLFNQKWEFLIIAEDLIPDDSSYLSAS